MRRIRSFLSSFSSVFFRAFRGCFFRFPAFGLHEWGRSPTIRRPRLHGRGASEPVTEAHGSHGPGTEPAARTLRCPSILAWSGVGRLPLSVVGAANFVGTGGRLALGRRHATPVQNSAQRSRQSGQGTSTALARVSLRVRRR